jgi:hypothetical protein
VSRSVTGTVRVLPPLGPGTVIAADRPVCTASAADAQVGSVAAADVAVFTVMAVDYEP